MKIDILNRFNASVMFTANIECADDAPLSIKIGLAIKIAVKANANLSGANLSGANLYWANLSKANLSEADLSGANLYGANLSKANLSEADLSGANLYWANLSKADLSGANLYGADLSKADLSGANLYGANLSGADLSGADLIGAYLSEADLRIFKSDMWFILAQNKTEIAALIDALKNGRVNGTCYEGACACLVGTIANAKNVDYRTLLHNAGAPIERWFAMIRKGDKPTDNTGGGFASKLALEWAEEFQKLMEPQP